MKRFYQHVRSGLVYVIEFDEAGWWVAHVPSLPGCVSQGRTLEEAKMNVAEAIEATLEVLKEDAPERYERLTSVTSVPQDWESDATVPFPIHWLVTSSRP